MPSMNINVNENFGQPQANVSMNSTGVNMNNPGFNVNFNLE